jgi:putative ABC transport system permease protein
MIGHYLKVFFHNLLRQKAITVINISGLAIGMAVFMLVSLYVVEEFSHEKRWDAHWCSAWRMAVSGT